MTTGTIERSRVANASEGCVTTDEQLISRLRDIATVRLNEPLGRHTTFGVGGPADVYVTVRSSAQLAATFAATHGAGAPCFILGSGSNILVGDAGIRGVVIDNQAKATRIEPLHIAPDSPVPAPRLIAASPDSEAVLVWAESGMSFAALARNLARQGVGGMEWACGIPGSVGGAAVYNAGAYGGSLSDVLLAATIADEHGATRYLPARELGLRYRSSIFLRHEIAPAVVLSLELAGVRGDAAALTAKVADIDTTRLSAQPRGRTGGSTFKNPDGHQAWELIDAVGLRGHRIGDAQVSDKHCNFFMNVGAARAADVFALMQEARRRVSERFGVELENEVELVGEGF